MTILAWRERVGHVPTLSEELAAREAERVDLRAALATAKASERERCAKRCESKNSHGDFPDAKRFAAAIRSRKDEPAQGEQKE